MAEPVGRFPSVFHPGSLWERYPFLLPNIVVAAIFAVTSSLGVFLLKETNPNFSNRSDTGVRIGLAYKMLWRKCVGMWKGQGYTAYSIVGEACDVPISEQSHSSAAEGHTDNIELRVREKSTMTNASGVDPEIKKKRFTGQIILQIISVSLLAFHKVASDSLIPVFLATPRAKTDKPRAASNSPFNLSGGFGLSSASIGYVLLTQAVTAILVQFLVVPRVITKFGALRTYRWTLFVFPWLYCMTPFVVKLPPPLSLIALLVDLWVKVLLVALGYVCSAIL